MQVRENYTLQLTTKASHATTVTIIQTERRSLDMLCSFPVTYALIIADADSVGRRGQDV